MIGTMFGPYRVEALLGRGGMGEVYRARDTGQGGRSVALKVLPAGLSDDRAFVARFRREAEIAARVAEPHVVPIHRYGEIDGRLFLDMRLVDGRELADLLPLDPPRAVAVVEQVAAALDAAHADGLVHRDVKPSNILVTAPGRGRPEFAYLVDFGIATAVEPGSRTALTRTGAVVGTLAYMAPERFLAQPAGPPADVYALACVLHEALTGKRPFPGTGYGPQILGHLELPPPRPSELRPGLPPAFDAVIARGMAKEPADRPGTAGELAAHARRALTDGTVPVLPPHVPAWTPPPAPRRSRRRWVAAVLAVAVLATGGALAVTRPWEVPPAAAPAVEGPVLPGAGPFAEVVIAGPDIVEVASVGGVPVLVDEPVDGDVQVYDLGTGRRLGRTVPGRATASDNNSTAGERAGTTVVFSADDGGTVRLLDVGTGQPLAQVLFAGGVPNSDMVVLDPGGLLVAGGYDGQLRAVDVETGEPSGTPLATGVGRITRLAAVAVDGRPAVVAAGALGTEVDPGSTADTLRLLDPVAGQPLGPPITDPSASRFALTRLDGRPAAFVPTAGNGFTVYDLLTGAAVLTGLPERGRGGPVTVGERTLLATADDDDAVRLSDLRTGEPVGEPLVGHEDAPLEFRAVEHAGRSYLLTSGLDRTVRVWDLTARVGG